MNDEIRVGLKAKNIGPHENLVNDSNMRSIKIGVYAPNGSGKTFISRMFRLCALQDGNELIHTNNLLRIGQDSGNFSLSVSNSSENKVLEIDINRDKSPIIRNESGYLFHVFNEDYVEQNLKAKKYTESEKIEGYILGKENIDLSEEKENLKRKQAEQTSIKKSVEENITKHKNTLLEAGLKSNTAEYRAFNFDSVFLNHHDPKLESSSLIKDNIEKLNEVPTNLLDIDILSIKFLNNYDNYFDEMSEILRTEYAKCKIDENVKDKIVSKLDFVKLGLKIGTDDECPFCERQIDIFASEVISKYNDYISDNESVITAKIESYIELINIEIGGIESFEKSYREKTHEYGHYNRVIPSIKNKQFPVITDSSEICSELQNIQELLEQKKKDIGATVNENLDLPRQKIAAYLESLMTSITKTNLLIEEYNSVKSNLNAEKLVLKKNLCRAVNAELASNLQPKTKKFTELSKEIISLEENIVSKEHKQKISKQDKVVASLKEFLKMFFAEKYSFDEKSYCFKYYETPLNEDASSFLSEGEKNIVAFCHYLSRVHTMIHRETDYDKIFYIIDDPISSLDFNYVYSVNLLIRNLNEITNSSRSRYIVLTHNMEFLSVLDRNGALNNLFMINKGQMEKINEKLSVPYEHHLIDLYNVTRNRQKPSHTTPNSIRHVIETLNNFESPDMSLEKYCKNIEAFWRNSFIYTLMNDASHGGIRINQSYTEDMLIEGCKVVVTYIESKFPGQLAKLKK